MALARVLKGMLFSIGPYDPLSFLSVALLLAIMALAATLIPARSAECRPNGRVASRISFSPYIDRLRCQFPPRHLRVHRYPRQIPAARID